MELKIRASSRPLQYLVDPARVLFSVISGRFWLKSAVLVLAVVAAFYAGGKAHIRGPVVQFVDSVVDFKLSTIDKLAKGMVASPRKIQIDIKHINYQKLQFKREQAFNRGLIITTKDSYVPATFTVEGRSYRVRMRLKGDYPNHLTGKKWSFRIIVKGDEAIWGMKRFSIQDPKRSGWLKEWVMYAWLKHEGLIALRYDYVHVAINGRELGIFALEESFGKELLEHNRRPEAPILKFDESIWIDQSSTNRGDGTDQHDVYQLADITSFNLSKTLETDKLKQGFLVGRTLLTQLRSRERRLSEVMDVGRAARTFAILDILGNYHALRWKNSRFYYNPIAARLELIAYNAYGEQDSLDGIKKIAYQRWLSGKFGGYHVQEWIDAFFSDESFVTAYFDELNRITAPGYLEQFFEAISAELDEKRRTLYQDGITDLTSIKEYLDNRDAVYEILHPKMPLKAYLKDFDGQSGELILTVANTSYLPARFEAVECSDMNRTFDKINPVRLASKNAGAPLQYAEIRIGGVSPTDETCVHTVERSGDRYVVKGLRLRYRILGAVESRWTTVDADPVALANELIPPPSGRESATVSGENPGMVKIDENSRQIAIQSGRWELSSDLVFPAGYRVVGTGDTAIVLNDGAAVISFSPLDITGTADSPFIFQSYDGNGQGIAVISAGAASQLTHVTFRNLRSIKRDSWSLTGSVTFYDSEVQFSNLVFEGNRAEDMINLIRSDFSISDSRFDGSMSDALDVDFGNGIVQRSTFSNCGNDCIDVSGSKSKIDAVIIEGAGDKGISVGERSQVEIIDTTISGAVIGVASKDGSMTRVSKTVIRDAGTGLASYQKKPEFDDATLIADEVVVENSKSLYLLEGGSKIVHDGRTVSLKDGP